MRTKDSINNSIILTCGQFVSILIQFIVRLFFVRQLGDVCNSINGLFTNIISILSIADLGLASAVCFSLYKPLIDDDRIKTIQMLHFYKKMCRVVGTIIFIIGLSVMPFLHSLIGNDNMIENIYIIYVLYLLKTCLAYWMYYYRLALIQADQKQYKVQKYIYMFDVICALVQMACLFIIPSFILFILIAVIFAIINNVFIGIYIKNKYLYITVKPKNKLPKEDKKALMKNIYGTALYKVGGAIYNSTDAILISASSMINFLVVGYYSNYMLIFNALTSIIGKVIHSAISSIGNYNLTESKEKKKSLFYAVSFVNFWIYGVVGICCLCLVDSFTIILYGVRCVLDHEVVILMVANFVLSGLIDDVVCYKDACGLFYQGKARPIISSVLNITLSIVLCGVIGLSGVILGTILSRFLSTFWYEPWLVFKNVFDMKPWKYYVKYCLNFIFICVLAGGAYYIFSLITIGNIFAWIVAGVVLFIVLNLIFLLCFYKSASFKFVLKKLKVYLKCVKKDSKQ